MEVPENSADRWSRVLDSYELYFAVNSPWLMWMIDLIRDVMASPLAQELYPHTSHYSLCVSFQPESLRRMNTPFVALDVDQKGEFEVHLYAEVGTLLSSKRCSSRDAFQLFVAAVEQLRTESSQKSQVSQ
jgi:hypothetical protein